eukprot:jgi/Psemu1/314252/fgenesh1_kg.1469_\
MLQLKILVLDSFIYRRNTNTDNPTLVCSSQEVLIDQPPATTTRTPSFGISNCHC